MIREIDVSIPLGIDVLIFLKDVLRVPNSISGMVRTSNTSQGPPKEYIDHDNGDRGLDSFKNRCN